MEMKGFNVAYNNMLVIEAKKKAEKEFLKKRINQAISEGVDKEVAKVMIQTMFEYGLIQMPECGFVEA